MKFRTKSQKRRFERCSKSIASTALAVGIFGLAAQAHAQIIFSEILYDAPGGDTDHEWIEIQNTGADTVDVTKYKLTEGTTNHTLTAFQGSSMVPGGAFAIIVKNPKVFLGEHPNFSGTIFDSTFSLSNTGETLVLKDSTLSEIDSVMYTSNQGANGNGQTLQKVNGVWTTGNPTPGVQNAYTPAPVKVDPVPAAKNPSTKTAPKSSSAKKLSTSKVVQILDTPADTSKNSSATVDLSAITQNQSSSDGWKWYVGLAALVAVAIGGIFTLRYRVRKPQSEYEIIE